jgi:hypothetical protein
MTFETGHPEEHQLDRKSRPRTKRRAVRPDHLTNERVVHRNGNKHGIAVTVRALSREATCHVRLDFVPELHPIVIRPVKIEQGEEFAAGIAFVEALTLQ